MKSYYDLPMRRGEDEPSGSELPEDLQDLKHLEREIIQPSGSANGPRIFDDLSEELARSISRKLEEKLKEQRKS